MLSGGRNVRPMDSKESSSQAVNSNHGNKVEEIALRLKE